MRLNTRGRYAVAALADLVVHGHSGPVPVADMARRCGLSRGYLEQLFVRLRRAGLVRSARGKSGGYELALPPEQISIGQVIAAVDPGLRTLLAAATCPDAACPELSDCPADALCSAFERHVAGFFGGITLADLCARRLNQRQGAAVTVAA